MGKPVWDQHMIRRIITSDMYRPHSFDEVSELIAPEVAARLDQDTAYGIQWYNRQRVTVRTVSEPNGDEGRRYRKKRTFRWRPKEDWIAIPFLHACPVSSSTGRVPSRVAPKHERGNTWRASGSSGVWCVADAAGR